MESLRAKTSQEILEKKKQIVQITFPDIETYKAIQMSVLLEQGQKDGIEWNGKEHNRINRIEQNIAQKISILNI